MVAHYVRDVGVGRSSRLIPTDLAKEKKLNEYALASFCFFSNVKKLNCYAGNVILQGGMLHIDNQFSDMRSVQMVSHVQAI